MNDITQDYQRETRAAKRNDFRSDERRFSTFSNSLAKLLNHDVFTPIKCCTELKQAKKIISDNLGSSPL